MPEIKWIKITTSMFDDEKIKLIESMPDKDSILIIWIKLLILAGKINDCGHIYLSEDIPYTDEMLSTVFNRPLNTVRLALETFRKFGMITCNVTEIRIINWEKHQNIDGMEKIRRDTRLRVQKYRELKKLESHNVNLTINSLNTAEMPKNESSNEGCNVTVTQRNAIEEEKNKNKKENKKEKNSFSLPCWVNQETWAAFLEVRKKKKAVQTSHALKLVIHELEKIRATGEDPEAVLNQSIRNSWIDVWPLKDKSAGNSPRAASYPKPPGVFHQYEDVTGRSPNDR
jgi:predicted phage replisome organizer